MFHLFDGINPSSVDLHLVLSAFNTLFGLTAIPRSLPGVVTVPVSFVSLSTLKPYLIYV